MIKHAPDPIRAVQVLMKLKAGLRPVLAMHGKLRLDLIHTVCKSALVHVGAPRILDPVLAHLSLVFFTRLLPRWGTGGEDLPRGVLRGREGKSLQLAYSFSLEIIIRAR